MQTTARRQWLLIKGNCRYHYASSRRKVVQASVIENIPDEKIIAHALSRASTSPARPQSVPQHFGDTNVPHRLSLHPLLHIGA